MCSGELAPHYSPFRGAPSCSLVSSGFVQSAPECKELQLSEDQNRAMKPGHGLASTQDHPRHFRGKGARMKPKPRAAPYPEVSLQTHRPAARKKNQKPTFNIACFRRPAGRRPQPVGPVGLLASDGRVEGEICDPQRWAELQLRPRGRTGSDPSVPAEAAASTRSAA